MSMIEKDLLQKLVKIPSINPDFDFSSGKPTAEAPLTDFLQSLVERQGWPWLRQEVHPGRDNLVALCNLADLSAESPVILFEVHQDTVGVAGMSIKPFDGYESEGKIWGRGACDVKGAMAAMLTALAAHHANESGSGPTVLIAFTINEENGFTGAKALCKLWQDSESEKTSGTLELTELRKLLPTRVIVGEPTELDVVVAHKGSIRWECHAYGEAAHTSQPELGVNAVTAIAEVVKRIEGYQMTLSETEEHSLCGRPSLCVSTIEGGSGVNTVPDHAMINIDFRTVPGKIPEENYQELIQGIQEETQKSSARIEHKRPYSQCPGLEDHNNRLWAEQIASVVSDLGQPSQLIGVPYGTNAWVYAQQGWPTVVFGPGSISQAHTSDEWISLEQLALATRVFQKIASDGI